MTLILNPWVSRPLWVEIVTSKLDLGVGPDYQIGDSLGIAKERPVNPNGFSGNLRHVLCFLRRIPFNLTTSRVLQFPGPRVLSAYPRLAILNPIHPRSPMIMVMIMMKRRAMQIVWRYEAGY